LLRSLRGDALGDDGLLDTHHNTYEQARVYQ
jgi:hypothetical protein